MNDHNIRITNKRKNCLYAIPRYFKYRRNGFGRRASFWLALNCA